MQAIHEGILVWSTCGGMLTVVGFTIGTFLKVGRIEKENSSKVGRVYTRLDEVKKGITAETVPQRMCDVLHGQTIKDIAEIKGSVKCIPKIKANLDLLLQKNNIETKD